MLSNTHKSLLHHVGGVGVETTVVHVVVMINISLKVKWSS